MLEAIENRETQNIEYELEKIETHIVDFINETDLDELQKFIIESKYIKREKLDVRRISRLYKKTMKYTDEMAKKLDKMLYSYLKKII